MANSLQSRRGTHAYFRHQLMRRWRCLFVTSSPDTGSTSTQSTQARIEMGACLLTNHKHKEAGSGETTRSSDSDRTLFAYALGVCTTIPIISAAPATINAI
eukprot:scaffold14725_cov144-Skeletonema_dohrnii-CCMP3373.AAC.2